MSNTEDTCPDGYLVGGKTVHVATCQGRFSAFISLYGLFQGRSFRIRLVEARDDDLHFQDAKDSASPLQLVT